MKGEIQMKLMDSDAFIADMIELYSSAKWEPSEVHFSLTDLSCNIDSPEYRVKAITTEQLLSILPKYDDYIHAKTYPHNEIIEDIYSKGHEEGWNACLKAIKEELDYWEKENERV